MSASGEMWIAEYERIGDDFIKDQDKERAKARLRKLGIDDTEIDEHLSELQS